MGILGKKGKFAQKKERKGLWRGAVTGIAAIVVFCTTYALILPAITMETQGLSCGLAEHTHSQDCYQLICGKQEYFSHSHSDECYENGALVCTLTERTLHHHSEDCYSKPEPICGLTEGQGHTHAESCYTTERTLVCTQSECSPHTHSDGCYTEEAIPCTQEAVEGHTHGEDCYTDGERTCGKEETQGHTHSEACAQTKQVLTCTLAETQGHSHSDECYEEKQLLSCGQEAREAHTHSESCYPSDFQPTLICGQEDIPEHRHNQDCYARICELEEHTHSELCVENHEAFLENQNEILKSSEEQSNTQENSQEQSSNEEELNQENSQEQASNEEEQNQENSQEQASDNETQNQENSQQQASNNEEQNQQNSQELASNNEEQNQQNSQEQASNEEELNQENSEEQSSENEKETSKKSEEQSSENEEETSENSEEQSSKEEEQTMENSEEQSSEEETLTEENGETEPDIEVDWSDPESAVEAGFYPVCDNYEEEHVHTQECYVPIDEVEDSSESTDFSTRSATDPVSFNDKITGATASATYVDEASPYYKTFASFTWSTTKEQIISDGYYYVFDVGEDLKLPEGSQNTDIGYLMTGSASNQKAVGEFTRQMGEDGHLRLFIRFYDDVITGEGEIQGTLKFSGSLDASKKDASGNLTAEIPGSAELVVNAGDIYYPDDTASLYDISVNKSCERGVIDATNLSDQGKRTLTYTVVVSSEKGTPDVINFQDVLSMSAEKNLKLSSVTIGQGAEATALTHTYNTDNTVTPNRHTISAELPKLEAGEQHIITYTYELNYQGDTTNTDVHNDVAVESIRGGDYPIKRKVSDTDEHDEKSVTPPPPPDSPHISKQCTPKLEEGSIDWTITFNENNKSWSFNGPDQTIFDQMMEKAENLVVKVGGEVVTDYTLDSTTSSITIPAKYDGQKVEITYSTDAGNIGNWGNTDTAENKAYFSWYGTNVSDTASFSKNGGAVSKQGGSGYIESDTVYLPWTVTITPGRDGMDISQPFSDYLDPHSSGSFTHHFDTNSLDIYYTDQNGNLLGPVNSGIYTPSFYYSKDNGNNGITNNEHEDKNYMQLQFSQDPFDFLPEGATMENTRVVIAYRTVTDGVPESSKQYYNAGWIGEKHTGTQTATYTAAETRLSKAAETPVLTDSGSVRMKWNVTVSADDGKLFTAIKDTLHPNGGDPYNHYFDEASTSAPVLSYVIDSTVYTLDASLYSVKYYQDCEWKWENNASVLKPKTSENSSIVGNTYMEITFTGGKLQLPGDVTDLTLSYYTLSSSLNEEGQTYFNNKVYANGKEAWATAVYTPKNPTVAKSYDGEGQSEGEACVFNWSVTVQPDGAVVKTIHEILSTDQSTSDHFFDKNTVKLAYYKTVDGAAVYLGDVPQDAYQSTFYHHVENMYVTPLVGVMDSTDPRSKYLRINFSSDPFDTSNCPEGAEFIKLTYSTYSEGVPIVSTNFSNMVRINGITKYASKNYAVSPTTIAKFTIDGNNDWQYDGADNGTNTSGELYPWVIQVSTGSPFTRRTMTISDELPEWISASALKGQLHHKDNGNTVWDTSILTLGANGDISGSVEDTTVDPHVRYLFTGSCTLDSATNRYRLNVTITPEAEGYTLPENTEFNLYITPQVDTKRLPKDLRGTQFEFVNQATVDIGGLVLTSNPNKQTWEHDYHDVGEGSLKKGLYESKNNNNTLEYSVKINPEGINLEEDSNVIVLTDTLTYQSQVDVINAPTGVTISNFALTLNTSSVRLYNTVMTGDVLTKGTEYAGSWRWVLDTDTAADGTISKIIRAEVPDATPFILDYSYVLTFDTSRDLTDAEKSTLRFSYTASNSVELYGHKGTESTLDSSSMLWEYAEMSGSAEFGKSLVVKKIEEGNNGVSISGANFKIQRWDATLNNGAGDFTDHHTDILTDNEGTITIFSKLGESNPYHLDYNTLYRIVEVAPAVGYLPPDSPEEHRFYISSSNGTPLDTSLQANAIDLSAESSTVFVTNRRNRADFQVVKSWKKDNVTVSGGLPVTFDIYRVTSKNPVVADSKDDPLLITRTVTVILKSMYNSTTLATETRTLPKGTTMTVDLICTDFNSGWSFATNPPTISPNPAGMTTKVTGYQDYSISFPVNSNLTITIAARDNTTMTVSPAAKSGESRAIAAPSSSEILSVDCISPEAGILLNASNSFSWSSQRPGFDYDFPIQGTTNAGETVWYSYYAVERDGEQYSVSYSNVSNGVFQGITSGTIAVTNTMPEQHPVTLPNTGGMGTGIYTAAGLAVSIGAVLGLMKKRKKGERE